LPEAELDRFLLRIAIGYPDEESERELVRRGAGQDLLPAVQRVTDGSGILALQKAVQAIEVSPPVLDYIVAVTRALRTRPGIALGPSPRATLALTSACRAQALLDGRDFVVPDDVQGLAEPVLGHRIMLDASAELGGTTRGEVIAQTLEDLPVPFEGQGLR
jgi:MoxR-like ATPase